MSRDASTHPGRWALPRGPAVRLAAALLPRVAAIAFLAVYSLNVSYYWADEEDISSYRRVTAIAVVSAGLLVMALASSARKRLGSNLLIAAAAFALVGFLATWLLAYFYQGRHIRSVGIGGETSYLVLGEARPGVMDRYGRRALTDLTSAELEDLLGDYKDLRDPGTFSPAGRIGLICTDDSLVRVRGVLLVENVACALCFSVFLTTLVEGFGSLVRPVDRGQASADPPPGRGVEPTAPGAHSRLFISYSHKDRRHLERFQVFLKPLEHAGLVDRWDDTMIQPGMRWRDEIRQALAAAKVAVLLISGDFLASDFIAKDELPPLLAAEQGRGLIIIPVIVGPSRFERTPGLAQFEAANDPSKPLSGMTPAERDRVWVELVNRVEDLLRRA